MNEADRTKAEQGFRTIQRMVHCTAVAKGFWDEQRSRAVSLALIHSEVSEALEADRMGDKDGFAEELADVVIRVMDLADSEEIDLASIITRKNEKNAKRPYKHGKNY